MAGVGRGVGSGGKRPGAGRPKGSIHKKARELVAKAEQEGLLLPIDYLLGVMRDPNAEPRDRMSAAGMAAPYCHARLTAMKATTAWWRWRVIGPSRTPRSISPAAMSVAGCCHLPRQSTVPSSATPAPWALSGRCASHQLLGGYAGDIAEIGGSTDVLHAQAFLARRRIPLAPVLQQTVILTSTRWSRIEALSEQLLKCRRLTHRECRTIVGRL